MRYSGTRPKEEQRNRGTVGAEEKRSGTQEQWAQRNRGTEEESSIGRVEHGTVEMRNRECRETAEQ